MKKQTISMTAVVMALSSFATATVEINSLTCSDTVPHIVTATYTLSEDAVVTADVLTNGVTVGGLALTAIGGDVNRKVSATSGDEVRSVQWIADASFEGQSLSGENVQVNLTAWARETPPDYMVVDLLAPSNVMYYASESALPGGVQDRRYKSEKMLFRKISAKGVHWVMGIGANQTISSTYYKNVALRHKVQLTHDYYFGVYQVTEAQKRIIEKVDRSAQTTFILDERLPETSLSYYYLRGSGAENDWPQFNEDGAFDAEKSHRVSPNCLIDRLRQHTGLAFIDLPTEAQWEFAARAGSSALLPNNESFTKANTIRYARCSQTLNEPDCEGLTYGGATVGTYLPNAWGIYNVVGNGLEWCLDRWERWDQCGPNGGPIDPFAEQVDPVGSRTSTLRVARSTIRGEDWSYQFITKREGYSASTGGGNYTCRLALTLY